MWQKIKLAREQRAAKVAAMNTILSLAETENRDLNSDECAKFDAERAAIEGLDKHIGRLESAYEIGKTPEQRGKPGQELHGDGAPKQTGDEDPGKPFHLRSKIDGFAVKDLRRYSLLRAIRLSSEKKPLDGVEAEVSKEIELRTGEPAKGFYFPTEIPTGIDFTNSERRTLNASTGTGAIATILDASNFIDLLRVRMVLNAMGVRWITGLVGNLALPRQTSGGTAYWVADESAPTASAQAIGQVSFAPNTLGAYTDLSRKFILQSSLSAEAFVRADLAKILAIELDRAGINGSGSSNQPTGILQQSGIGSVAGGTNGLAWTFANAVALETAVAAANADMGSLGYITNAKVRGSAKTILQSSVAGANWIWQNTDNPLVGQVNGYKAMASNNVPSNLTKGTASGICSAAIFGNFDDAVYAMWGNLDIMVDPYTNSNTGSVRVVALQDVDFQLRHAASFAATSDILA